jgi:hypothetical protein
MRSSSANDRNAPEGVSSLAGSAESPEGWYAGPNSCFAVAVAVADALCALMGAALQQMTSVAVRGA